jgi:Zn-dependent M16 (insulinase) family peptidase
MISYLIGSEQEHRDAFLTLYTDTLQRMVEEGLDRDLVLAELNKFEFGFREESSKAQRGLDRIGKAMNALKYGNDPFLYLTSEELIKNLRHKALNENYFEELIKKYLLNNPSNVTVTLIPDPGKQLKNQTEERQRLAEYDAAVTEKGKVERIEKTNKLMEEQQTPNSLETLSLLPQLTLEDLSTKVDFHSVTLEKMFGQQLLISDLETNHISYIDVGFNFSCLPPRLLPWLDLFGTILTEIGTKRLNYKQFAKEIATCTGSLSHSLNIYTRQQDADIPNPVLWLHLKCLPDYLEKALHLLTEIFSSVSFKDKTRIREIVGREFAWAEHATQSEGYDLPTTRLLSHLSTAGKYREMYNGITAYQAVKNLALNYDEEEESFLAAMQEIESLLFNKNNLLLGITGESKEIDHFTKIGSCITDALGSARPRPQPLPDLSLANHEAFITSAEVVFAVQGGNLLKGGRGYNGHFEVLKTYLSRDYLWNTVRQMGGAYGCFIQFGQLSGNLAFVSYRDPQVKKTYDAYNAVPDIVTNLDIPVKTMTQLITGTYGNFAPLQSSAAKGATARNEYLNGIDTEYKQRRIKEITQTTVADLRSFGQAFTRMTAESHRSIIGNRSKIEADSELFDVLTEL